jgi:hypothetical protein
MLVNMTIMEYTPHVDRHTCAVFELPETLRYLSGRTSIILDIVPGIGSAGISE